MKECVLGLFRSEENNKITKNNMTYVLIKDCDRHDFVEDLKDKKDIVISGYGRAGKEAIKLCKSLPQSICVVIGCVGGFDEDCPNKVYHLVRRKDLAANADLLKSSDLYSYLFGTKKLSKNRIIVMLDKKNVKIFGSEIAKSIPISNIIRNGLNVNDYDHSLEAYVKDIMSL